MKEINYKNEGKLFAKKLQIKQIPGILMLFLFLMSPMFISSQSVLKIPSGSDISKVIHGDTTATGEWNDRIYELKRDGFYTVTSPLNKVGAKLHIRGEKGEGFLPAIFPQQAEGGAWPSVLLHAGDLTLEYLYISNQNGAQDKWRGIAIVANKTRVEITGCHIENERGAGFMFSADSVSCFIRDSRFSKCGQRTDPGGNGRVIDTRSKYVDTLVVQNTTFYLVMDRALRTQGGTINYLEWDHTTGFNHMGRFGFLQLGRVNTAKITNNLFINSQLMGDNPLGLDEQLQPEDDNVYMMTIDAIVDDMQMEVRNNNFAWSQDVIDFWNTKSDTLKPDILTASIKAVIGQDAIANAYFEEYVEFTKAPAFPMDYMEALFAETPPETYPQWMESDNVGISNVDCSYAESYDSYTAGDEGYPLGDLNHFPDLKAQWAGYTSVNENINRSNVIIYPNPATEIARLNIEADAITLFDITGKLVSKSYNTSSVIVADLPRGIYFANIKKDERSVIQKLIVR